MWYCQNAQVVEMAAVEYKLYLSFGSCLEMWLAFMAVAFLVSTCWYHEVVLTSVSQLKLQTCVFQRLSISKH